MVKKSEARFKQNIDFAKSQRRMASDYVLIAWQWVRDRQVLGQKFRREHPVPPYTVDFFCVELGYKLLQIPGYEIPRVATAARSRIVGFVKGVLEGRKKVDDAGQGC